MSAYYLYPKRQKGPKFLNCLIVPLLLIIFWTYINIINTFRQLFGHIIKYKPPITEKLVNFEKKKTTKKRTDYFYSISV